MVNEKNIKKDDDNHVKEDESNEIKDDEYYNKRQEINNEFNSLVNYLKSHILKEKDNDNDTITINLNRIKELFNEVYSKNISFEEKLMENNLKIFDLVKELKDSDNRVRAAIENERKEVNTEITRILESGNKRLVLIALDFLIDLREKFFHNLSNNNFNDELKSYIEGLMIMEEKFWEDLGREGLKEMEVKPGDKWNSIKHSLVRKVENSKLPPLTIVEVIEKGYLLNNNIIRTAKVTISN